MKYLSLLVAILLGFNLSHAQITSKHIQNYGPGTLRTGETVFSVTADNEGILFFATDQGVLAYDGETWQSIVLNNGLGTRTVEYDSIRNRVWVGGLGTFGYLQQDDHQRYRYISISDAELQKMSFKKVWQIIYSTERVIFTTYEGHFEFDGNTITRTNVENYLLFVVNGYRYLSGRNKKSMILREGNRPPIENLPENIFQVLELDPNHHLMITQEEGVYVHELSTGRITTYHAPLHDLLKKHPVYATNQLTKNLLVNTTWNHGILITDLVGNLMDHITAEKGIISNYVLDTELDRFGKLWIATDYGVSVVNLKKAWPYLQLPSKPFPKTMIKTVELNHDSIIYVRGASDSIYLSHRPKNLRIRFATPQIEYMTNHQYYVQLEGYDTAWHIAKYHSFEEYNNLPNGNYRFLVKTKIGETETQSASFQLTIQQPWYGALKHAWLFILIVLITIILIILIASIITYRLKASKNKLAQLVAEKTQELERRERDLKTMNQSLLEINSELDSFLYRSSHDLVSPVKSVQGLLALMKLSRTDSKFEIDYDQYFHLMEDRMKRLENILAEITTYVKSAKREPVKSQFLLKDLVNEVWAEVEFMDGAQRIDCLTDIDENLEIVSDRDRWKMVLTNLITNAIKYHDQKKENPFIQIAVTRDDHAIKLAVADNGQGIDPKYQNRLFEMFYRATESSQGTGLGLFLVKKVVNSLNGSITLESSFREGTKVYITIPTAA